MELHELVAAAESFAEGLKLMGSYAAFGRFHPIVNFIFFALAIAFCVVLRHPAFQIASLLCAGACCLCFGKCITGRTVAYLGVLLLTVSLANPLFNPMGDTVLFSYFGGRVFTGESLAFGVSSGLMLVSMLLWFFAFSSVMTTDKLTFLFGNIAPALSLVTVMVLRLIPQYRDKLQDFALAREGAFGSLVDGEAGKASSRASKVGFVEEALARVSMLLTWAFEGGVQTADSMRSRGYGIGRRSVFSIYRFCPRDVLLLCVMLVLGAAVLLGVLAGLAYVQYLPLFEMAHFNVATAGVLAAYVLLLSVPVIVQLWEVVAWRVSLSRI